MEAIDVGHHCHMQHSLRKRNSGRERRRRAFPQASFSVKTDGTIPKENLREIYKCLFQSEFDSSHQGLADFMALNKELFQSKLELTTEHSICSLGA